MTVFSSKLTRRAALGTLAAGAVIPAAHALTHRPELDASVRRTLASLEAQNPGARALKEKSVAALVFPRIIKGGVLLGGAYGEGAMMQNGQITGYYNSFAASYGLQAGFQWFGYALIFANQGALDYFNNSSGFEIGTGPSVVVVDQGMARRMSSSTITQDIYAFIFNQQGLMAGLGIEGTKISKD